jgi:hypothetical protein
MQPDVRQLAVGGKEEEVKNKKKKQVRRKTAIRHEVGPTSECTSKQSQGRRLISNKANGV